jgi:release factor glutamine methyltransferase
MRTDGFLRWLQRSPSSASLLINGRRFSTSVSRSTRKATLSDGHSKLLDEAERLLAAHGVPDAKESVRFLWQAARGNAEQFREFIERRSRREPVQYIIGEWDFHDITLVMRPPVLIPRPETEELVEFARQRLLNTPNKDVQLLDVGAGTGALGLALLKTGCVERCTAIDINDRAVALANENAQRLGLSRSYLCVHSSFQGFVKARSPSPRFDCIVSNPPYIPSGLLSGLQEEVRAFESPLALDGGMDGGDVAKQIIARAASLLRQNGLLFLELHETHDESIVRQWICGHRLSYLESKRDFRGILRFHALKLD